MKEADRTLNQILTKMESEVNELECGLADSSPEVQDLKRFLKDQGDQVKQRLDRANKENQKLEKQNRDISKKFAKLKKESDKELNQLKRANLQLKRSAMASSANKLDRKAEQALAEEQVRLALEEKMNELWRPEEVLNRIATFVDSNFDNVGNDELSSALANIKSRSEEIRQKSVKSNAEEVKREFAKKKVPNNDKLESKLRHELNRKVLAYSVRFLD